MAAKPKPNAAPAAPAAPAAASRLPWTGPERTVTLLLFVIATVLGVVGALVGIVFNGISSDIDDLRDDTRTHTAAIVDLQRELLGGFADLREHIATDLGDLGVFQALSNQAIAGLRQSVDGIDQSFVDLGQKYADLDQRVEQIMLILAGPEGVGSGEP